MRELGVLCLLLVGCSSGPKYRIDDRALAQIPTEEKQAVMAARNEQNVARDELRKAEADLQQVDRDLDVAENEAQAAALGVDSAELMSKSAAASGDLNRQAQAARELRIAELGAKAAEARLDLLEARKTWLKASLQAAESRIEVVDARLELEKARLAKEKGIMPSKDFELKNFELEALARARDYSEAKLAADKRRPAVLEAERKWQTLDREWSTARIREG